VDKGLEARARESERAEILRLIDEEIQRCRQLPPSQEDKAVAMLRALRELRDAVAARGA
jgi:hypothetical protein